MRHTPLLGLLPSVSLLIASVCHGDDKALLPPVSERFETAGVEDTPGF